MKLGYKEIILIIVLILFFVSGFFVSNHFAKIKKEDLKRELRIERIKNDSIKKVAEGHYSKLVADTLTKRQLRAKIKELEFEIDNPTEVGNISLSFDKKETKTKVEKKDSVIKLEDHYPNKKEPFITYSATINKYTNESRGLFVIRDLELITARGLNLDGTTRFDIKVPEFSTVRTLNIQSLDTYQSRRSNFAYLMGGQAVYDYNTNEIHAGVNFGLRHKKTYLTVGTATNGTINTGLTFEF